MFRDNILASFIIPVYNTKKYLERCLGSVTAIQNKHIEIIIVDDGSTDGGSSIYEKYAKLDSRISNIRKENRGVSFARNEGIRLARGEWIAFIDSDDEIVPEVYDSQLLRLDTEFELWMLGIASRDTDFFELKRECVQGEWSAKEIDVIKRGIFHQDMKSAKRLQEQGFNLSGPVAKFYQRKIIIENGFLFPENLIVGEDCIFNFLYLKYVKSVSYTNECGYFYWRNDDSVTHKFRKGKGKQYLDTVEQVCNILGKDYLQEYAQYGVRYYLYAMKLDWCHTSNQNSYKVRKKEAMQWRQKLFVKDAFKNFDLLQIRWEAIPIAYCAKKKWFLLCDLLLKMKEKLSVRCR